MEPGRGARRWTGRTKTRMKLSAHLLIMKLEREALVITKITLYECIPKAGDLDSLGYREKVLRR